MRLRWIVLTDTCCRSSRFFPFNSFAVILISASISCWTTLRILLEVSLASLVLLIWSGSLAPYAALHFSSIPAHCAVLCLSEWISLYCTFLPYRVMITKQFSPSQKSYYDFLTQEKVQPSRGTTGAVIILEPTSAATADTEALPLFT